LSQYKAIYVSGSHLRRTVAERLARWVETGGTLYTSGWGLARDECDQPLACMYAVLGLKSRSDVELWSEVNRYAAVALSPLRPLKVVPQEAATVNGAQPPAGGFRLAVGREPLNPLPETQVLARFGDGKPAATRHAYGKGTAYIVGFYSGLEYSTDILRDDYDLSRDFQPSKRALVAAPALAAGARPVVDASVPLVEGVLLRNAKSGQAAVTLVNWAYRAKGGGQSPFEPPGKSGLVSFEPITVAIRGAGRVREVRSAWSGKTLLFQSREKDIVVTLPHIEEADVLLLQYGD
jgi:hypothetical protein